MEKGTADIVKLSLPFTGGAGAAAALLGAPSAQDFRAAAGAACLVAAAAVLAAVCLRKGRSTALTAMLFFLLGALCRAVQWELPGSPGTSASLPERALQGFSQAISRIPFPHESSGALLRALLTGQRDRLGASTVKAFRAAGASHILALSGLHLGIIYLTLGRLLSFMGNTPAAWRIRSALTVMFCGFYTVMTGAGPSITRAFLFIALSEISRNTAFRKKEPLNIWCAALIIQLCAKPSVISSAGFQLSYLAMLGIFVLLPALQGWYPSTGRIAARFDPFRRLWNAMALSLSCQAFTAPVAWIHFHSFPRYFLLSNLISMPLTSALMICGLACTGAEIMGAEPGFLIKATDRIAFWLIRSLEIIASM